MKGGDRFAYNSLLGLLYCTFQGPLLTKILIVGDGTPHACTSLSHGRREGKGDLPGAVRMIFAELDAYFRGDPQRFSRELYRMAGTDFEKTVWETLLDVPYGQVRTYKWLAERIGRPAAARAVGQALGRNPLPIIVPCHRIVASDGTLGGFSCGVEMKRWLLTHEKLKRGGER